MINKDNTGSILLKYWPIVMAVSFTMLSIGGIYVKLDYISKAIDKTEAQFGIVNDRQMLTSQAIIEMRGINERQSVDISRMSQNIIEINGRVNLLETKSRWTPK